MRNDQPPLHWEKIVGPRDPCGISGGKRFWLVVGLGKNWNTGAHPTPHFSFSRGKGLRVANRHPLPNGITSSIHGFTLVELVVVLAIIATLCAVAIPSYSNYIQQAKDTKVVNEIHSLERDITIYYETQGQYPPSLAALGLGNVLDPWGNPYQYHRITGPNDGKARKDRFLHPINTDYDLYSMGPDGKTALPLTAKVSQDDIIRANNGQYIGVASDY